jgi:hypothetical protein
MPRSGRQRDGTIPRTSLSTVTGNPAEPILVDRRSGRPIDEAHFKFAAGPAAGEPIRRRLAFADRERSKPE